MKQINDYRQSQGLAEVKTDLYTCNFAAVRASEVTANFNHDGFTNRVNSKNLPYPSYHKIVENIAMNSNYQGVVPVWIASSGHAANLRANTTYGCIAFSNNCYTYESWTP
ncbi:MAG: CAP domain-containing protein [bacterium]|nr:CAP domain-containing protein [bacterium]